jgi:sec-independent protein translocase protein TatC
MADENEEQANPATDDGGGEVKSFLEHLEDLRWTLIKAGSALMVGMVACLGAANFLTWILSRPIEKANVMLKTQKIELDYLDPAGPFVSVLHLAFFGGILLTAPIIFYFVLQFVLPALKVVEKKYLFRALIAGSSLFMAGASTCYFWVMPLALRATVQFSNYLLGVTKATVMWRAETYFSFTTKCIIGMGLGFELPVVLLTLVKIGVLDYRKLAGMRRYMIIVCLVLGALLTTPEVLTQVIMAIPLYVLYEASVWIAWYWEWSDRKQSAAERH